MVNDLRNYVKMFPPKIATISSHNQVYANTYTPKVTPISLLQSQNKMPDMLLWHPLKQLTTGSDPNQNNPA